MECVGICWICWIFEPRAESLEDKCVFLAVSADWCGACQQMKPAWFALAKLLKSSKAVTVGVMNIDENEVDRLGAGTGHRHFVNVSEIRIG